MKTLVTYHPLLALLHEVAQAAVGVAVHDVVRAPRGRARGHEVGRVHAEVRELHLALHEQVAPGHPSVLTWNAEENRPMLDVNEAVGFVPLGYEGAWRKDL